MAVAVRCPECRRASQVGADALGMLVQCPACHEPFVALEEAPVTAHVRPAAPPKPRPRTVAEPVHDHTAGPNVTNGGLPVSVLFGFALLPLAIPLLWLIGPQLLPKPPSLTLAAPISLAISASVLCLAVVLTVDWSPMTRIKGVLILVGLSYFAGLSLYFLKREVVERVKDFFSPPVKWQAFHDPNGKWTVQMPGSKPEKKDGPLPGNKSVPLSCHESHTDFIPGPALYFVVGSCADVRPATDERWFDLFEQDLLAHLPPGTKHEPRKAEPLFQGGGEARRWVFEQPDGQVRIVRVIRSGGMIYYQAVQGERLDPESPFVTRFFDSFQIGVPPGK